jgi:DHA1 family multidrug resistance protein-like MFS transporter
MAFLYGLLYLFLTAYPIVFQRIHGFNKGVGGLPYFGIIIGEFLGGIFIIMLQPWYNRRLSKNKDIPIPEWRLSPAIIGGVAFSGGLFWFGCPGYRSDIHWIVPTLSGLLPDSDFSAFFCNVSTILLMPISSCTLLPPISLFQNLG